MLDLGRLIQAASDVGDRFDEAKTAVPKDEPGNRARFERGQMRAIAQEFALRDLAMTLPAHTLGDAAVQLALGVHVLDLFEDHDLTAARPAPEFRKLRRMVASVLPVVTRSAGLTLRDVGGEWIEDWPAREFPADPRAPLEAEQPADPDPEADLIAWAEEAITLDRERCRRLNACTLAMEEKWVEEDLEPLCRRLNELLELVGATAPATREGERAGARLAVQIRGDQPSSGNHEDLAWALIGRLAAEEAA